MKIKPHGSLYILPFGLLFTSIVVATILFVQAMFSPVIEMTEIEIGNVYEQELKSGDFISLFFEDDNIEAYSFYEEGEQYCFDVGADATSGFDIVTFEEENAFLVDDYLNFADIDITEDGTYTVIFNTYNENIEYGLQYYKWSSFGNKLLLAGVSLAVGIPAGIISFIVIIVIRSNSKKNLRNSPSNPQIDPIFINKEYEREKKEVDNHFDY